MNQTKTAASMHDGHADPDCKFHENHLHLMTKADYRIHHTFQYKRLNRNLQANNIELKSEEIKLPLNFGAYLLKPPREFLGTNTDEILPYIPRTPQTKKSATATNPNRKPTLYQQIENCINLMNKYQRDTKEDLFRATYNTTDYETPETETGTRSTQQQKKSSP